MITELIFYVWFECNSETAGALVEQYNGKFPALINKYAPPQNKTITFRLSVPGKSRLCAERREREGNVRGLLHVPCWTLIGRLQKRDMHAGLYKLNRPKLHIILHRSIKIKETLKLYLNWLTEK